VFRNWVSVRRLYDLPSAPVVLLCHLFGGVPKQAAGILSVLDFTACLWPDAQILLMTASARACGFCARSS
jgi:hypothetical protein